jgi:hypothetical protein
MLRWPDRVPENFVAGVELTDAMALPGVSPDRRLPWNLSSLYEALEAGRREQQLTWKELARILRCTDSQLIGRRTARLAANMMLAMRIVQWVGPPAAGFVYTSTW